MGRVDVSGDMTRHDEERLVQSPFMPHARDIGGCSIIAQKKDNRITRGKMHQHENNKGDSEENGNGTDDPACDRSHL